MDADQPDIAGFLAAWDPVVAGLAAAAQGNTQAARAVGRYLSSYRRSDDWAGLAGALSQILQNADRPAPAGDFDVIDAVVLRRAADAAAGRSPVPPELWPAMPLGPVLGVITDAARGHNPVGAQQAIDDLASEPTFAPLAPALSEILAGNHDPGLASALDNPTFRAVIACILDHAGTDREA